MLQELREDNVSKYPDGKAREEYLLFVEEPSTFREPLVSDFNKLLP
jgi:hypothetical protein